jgi:hypothetical protein
MSARRKSDDIDANPDGSAPNLDLWRGVAWGESLRDAAAIIVEDPAIMPVIAAMCVNGRHCENLSCSMITGYKRPASGADIDHAPTAH